MQLQKVRMFLVLAIVCSYLFTHHECLAEVQTCSSARCQLKCTAAVCSQSCGNAPCSMTCDAANVCSQNCSTGGCSNMDCKSAICKLDCEENCKKMKCASTQQCHISGGTNSSMACDSPYCNAQCNGKGCQVECLKKDCTVTCVGGYCSVKFAPESSGSMLCFGGHCKVRCPYNKTCDTVFCPGDTCSTEFYVPKVAGAQFSIHCIDALMMNLLVSILILVYYFL